MNSKEILRKQILDFDTCKALARRKYRISDNFLCVTQPGSGEPSKW